MMKYASSIAVALLAFSLCTIAQAQKKPRSTSSADVPAITFVELGSVNCIPCKAMQPVMKSIEQKYGNQVRVVFYDVWKDDQRKYAAQYSIRVIPTQVFLDAKGAEIMRHEGFFPEKDIDAFLQSKGLRVDTK